MSYVDVEYGSGGSPLTLITTLSNSSVSRGQIFPIDASAYDGVIVEVEASGSLLIGIIPKGSAGGIVDDTITMSSVEYFRFRGFVLNADGTQLKTTECRQANTNKGLSDYLADDFLPRRIWGYKN